MNCRQKEKEVLAGIDSGLLMKHTEYISSFDRESGSAGEKEAVGYFEKVMTEYGLDVKVEYIENLISLPVSAGLVLEDGRILECLTHSYAVSTPPEGLSSEAVFYPQNRNVAGKVAVFKGLASPGACYSLERQGATGLICINGGDYPFNMAISPIWGMPVPETADELGKIPVVSVNRTNGALLLDLLEKGPLKVVIKAEVDTRFRRVPLCVADLRASRPTEKFILFNGHIDSWHKGATDNATSNAAILEIARILKDFRDDLNVNVRFVWWSGHSNGRYSGSNWYADYHWEDIHDNAVLNVNIDAIGAKGSTSYRSVECSAQAYRLGFDVIKEHTGEEPTYSRIQRNGDQSFWGHGVPSLFQILSLQPLASQGEGTFVPGLPWYWHTIKDEFEQVGEEELALDTKIYLSAIWRFASLPVLPFEFAHLGRELVANIDDRQKAAGERFDLSLLRTQALRLSDLFASLDREISRLNSAGKDTEVPDGEAMSLNALVMKLNRILIPVHYCRTGPFEADTALPVRPFPGLEDLQTLVSLDPDSREFKFLERRLVRERNRIFHSLKKAALSLEEAIRA